MAAGQDPIPQLTSQSSLTYREMKLGISELLVAASSCSLCPQLQQHKDEDLSSLAQVSEPEMQLCLSVCVSVSPALGGQTQD